MAAYAPQPAMRARTAIGAALAAGAMLFAGPAVTALAQTDPTDPGGGSTEPTPPEPTSPAGPADGSTGSTAGAPSSVNTPRRPMSTIFRTVVDNDRGTVVRFVDRLNGGAAPRTRANPYGWWFESVND